VAAAGGKYLPSIVVVASGAPVVSCARQAPQRQTEQQCYRRQSFLHLIASLFAHVPPP
jgi:hypothetical protein